MYEIQYLTDTRQWHTLIASDTLAQAVETKTFYLTFCRSFRFRIVDATGKVVSE